MHRWYALYTRSNAEKPVESTLLSRGVEAYWPSYRVESRLGRRKFFVDRSLFPGYLFSRFDPLDPHLIHMPQVLHVLGSGRDPIAVPDAEVESVRQLASAPRSLAVTPWEYLTAGERVQVTQGPLRGVEGIVVEHLNHIRIVVSIQMLGAAVSAEVDGSWLRALKSKAA